MAKSGSIKQLSVGRKDLFILDPRDIQEEEGWNVRNDTEEFRAGIEILAESIIEVGVKQPLTVWMNDGVPVVTDGHRRLLAAKMAISWGVDIKGVPVRTEERHCDEVDRVLSMLVRNSGVPLTVPEQAKVVKRLLSFGWTEAEVARKTGSSRQHVNTLVKFMALPVEIKKMVDEGKVSATVAINQAKEEGGEGATKTLTKAVEKAESEGKKKITSRNVKQKDIVAPVEAYAAKLPADQEKKKVDILALCFKLRELIG